jgi:uncharacterized repeat protein (TIGR03806 family)
LKASSGPGICKSVGSWVGCCRPLGRRLPLGGIALAAALLGGCWSIGGETELLFPDVGEASQRGAPFLGFPAAAAESEHSPDRLSETLAFADLESLEPAPGLLPYAVQSPLWSDGARKQRWLAVPAGAAIGFSEAGAWRFPEGTVLVKHFGMALDERAPDEVQRLETRFLVAAAGGEYYGLVYKWDADQRDARLVLDGAEETLQIVQADGSVREQTYTYPSQRACNTCHSGSGGYVIGVRTAQLNGDYDYAGPSGGSFNQLALWSSLGLFERDASGGNMGDVPVDEYDRLVPLNDASAPLAARVRSYWDSNCSSCHNASSTLASWDASFSTPLDEQGVILAEPMRSDHPDDLRLIVPGAPERSLIYVRSESGQPGVRMPPLLRNRVDERYVELLGEWIRSL